MGNVLRQSQMCIARMFFTLIAMYCFSLGAAGVPDMVYHQSLGNLPFKTNLTTTIKWKNSSTNTLKVLKIEPSCDCLDVVSQPTSINPGQEGIITVRIHTSTAGLAEYAVIADVANDPIPKLFLMSALVAEKKKRPYPDQRFLLTVRDLLEQGIGKSVVIDVRSAEKNRLAHIPGSLNLPFYQVKTKAYLKYQNIILVNEGHDLEPLLDETSLLLSQKFSSVQVLEGGVRY